ncbi:MAG: DNA-directed RNA polymerase subunit omega [Candidatus Phytoplasma cynodontis]|uniref:DNA-directed RNA polymerase subunit omega n=1 Tax='Cynodon dactylon' phytoplasma TaxID=295320 RepID=UPI001265D54D|nr:DNA-directed RNA polymerase subunit omega ['Cynodon dactylon' phytoplasma]KAB8121988.1 DNA-directed RNA polymerase subunit omega ['Cynodon dactylon' phytoplasma]WIA07596.1 MAG: DNA-directed RNA polymerase subunit omega [Candidatus Phytoplasma cynodontis]
MLKDKNVGLNFPSIDELLKKIDSKYKLAYLSSKIAHIIEETKLDIIKLENDNKIDSQKVLSQALLEIINDNFEVIFK